MNLAGKKILVTGGTSRLGKAITECALERHAEVFFTYHRNAETARNLEKKGARGFEADFFEMKSIERFLDSFTSFTRELHTVIHNAAATRDVLIRDMTEEDWDYVLTVDLKAPYYLTQKLLPLLRRGAPSKVVMVTSRAAYTGAAGASNYAAAKAGLIGLAKSLAEELGPEKILVNIVNPGFMDSQMTAALPDEVRERHLASSPLHQTACPEETARFLCQLASDEMSAVTGQVFNFESREIPWA